jgi:hypothetical protein
MVDFMAAIEEESQAPDCFLGWLVPGQTINLEEVSSDTKTFHTRAADTKTFRICITDTLWS